MTLDRTSRNALIALLAILGVGALLFTFQAPPANVNEISTIMVGYRGQSFYLPVFVALDQHLFGKHGLNATATPFEDTQSMMLAMVSGRVDASLGGVNLADGLLASGKSQGQIKFIAFTGIDSAHRQTCLVALHPTRVEDLSGKPIGHVASAFGRAWANATLAAAHADASGLTPLAQDLLLPSVQSGRVAAAFLLEPACAKAETLGYTIVVNEPLGALFPNGFYFTTSVVRAMLAPKQRAALAQTYDDAVDFIRAHPDQAKQILARYTKMPPDVLERLALPHFLKTTETNATNVAQSIANLRAFGLLDGLTQTDEQLANLTR